MYYEYRYQGKVFDEDEVLKELNPVLKTTIVQFNQRWLIESAHMFQECSEEFKNAICQLLTFQLYLPDDILFFEGDNPSECHFVSRGTVSVIYNGEVLGRKIDGEQVGELSLCLPKSKRLTTAICDTCCYIYELDLDKYKNLCRYYKHDHKEVLKYAIFRLNEEHYFYHQLDEMQKAKRLEKAKIGIDKDGSEVYQDEDSTYFVDSEIN